MLQLKAYHRPPNVAEALQLFARPDVKTAIIGGGTSLVARLDEQIEEVVDLQAVGLTELTYRPNYLNLEAMVRLQTVVDDPRAPTLLRQTAYQAGPNTLRHAATIGGQVVEGKAESELLAALLVYETTVQLETLSGEKNLALADFWLYPPWVEGKRDWLVTAISIATSGQTASARVARTPMDSPIVAAVARRRKDGTIDVALCGVAKTPVLVDPTHLQAQIDPPSDFRGSAEYRREMAAVLVKRVLQELKPKEGITTL